MVRLLAMILTAYDSRKNPAAGLLWSATSHALNSVASLAGTLCGEEPSASSSPPKSESSYNSYKGYGRRAYKVLCPSTGKIVTVYAAD